MSLKDILAGKELEIVSKERILERQRTGKRPAKQAERIRTVDNPQKPARRFSVLRYLIPALVIPIVVGIPVGRNIANGIKEDLIKTAVGRKADYDGNGVVSDNEKAILYRHVFGTRGIEGLSLNEIYSRIEDYTKPIVIKRE